MKKIICLLAMFCFIPMGNPHAFEFSLEAFRWMAETTAEPCSICVKQKLEKAFNCLNKEFIPGKVLDFDEKCRLIKVNNENELKPVCYPPDTFVRSLKDGEIPPSIVFEFYTPGKQLVGISGNDGTDRKIADLFRDSEPGTVFEGRIRLVPYKYGDGPAYNYFPKTNKVVFHCAVIDLKPVRP